MKYFLFFSLFISANAMAIDFNKATGAFAEAEKTVATEEKGDLSFGSFNPDEDASRTPASTRPQQPETNWAFEASETFEYQNN